MRSFLVTVTVLTALAAAGCGRSSSADAPPRSTTVATHAESSARTTPQAPTATTTYTPSARSQAASVNLGHQFDRDAAHHSLLYALQRVNEKALLLVHEFHDPARQALANGVVAWQEQLAAAHPLNGLGAEATAMRKSLAAAGVTLPPPAADYGDCPVGQQPASSTGACAPPAPSKKPGCYGPSDLRFYNLAGIASCNAAIGVYLAYLAGTPPAPWTCEGDGGSGRCYFFGSSGVTDTSGTINWG